MKSSHHLLVPFKTDKIEKREEERKREKEKREEERKEERRERGKEKREEKRKKRLKNARELKTSATDTIKSLGKNKETEMKERREK